MHDEIGTLCTLHGVEALNEGAMREQSCRGLKKHLMRTVGHVPVDAVDVLQNMLSHVGLQKKPDAMLKSHEPRMGMFIKPTHVPEMLQGYYTAAHIWMTHLLERYAQSLNELTRHAALHAA